jgi:hypothetical protein
MSDWSDEETRDPLYPDDRNFYKVEKWTRKGTAVEDLLYAGNARYLDRYLVRSTTDGAVITAGIRTKTIRSR